MKTIQIIYAILLLSAPLHGQTSFVSAGRFIHLHSVDDEQQDDSYIRAEAIDSVVIYRSVRAADKDLPFKVKMTTRMLTTEQRSSPEAWSTDNRIYVVDCSSREEAEKTAAAILKVCSDGGNENKAQPADAGQPATASAPKSEGGDKPQPKSTPASK